jgi:hypothetical protein
MSINLSAFAGAGAQFFDANGAPLTGGLLYSYLSGTSTPVTTYTTRDGTANNTNPIVLDAAGRTPAEIWLDGGVLYKFVLKSSTYVQIGSYDSIPAINDTTTINNLITVAGTNTLTGLATPALAGYATGAQYSFIAQNNNTAAVTIDIDTLGVKSITKVGSIALVANDIIAGALYEIAYDGTRFQLLTRTSASQLVVGTTAQRPSSPTSGMIRQNSTTGFPEWYDTGTAAWIQFNQAPNYSVNYLVVAGGGGGGYSFAGGGGAGGLLASTATLTSGTGYTVTVGAGGAGGTSGSTTGNNGSASAIVTVITATGGGGGGGGTLIGSAGGSGGGGGGGTSTAGAGGAGTSGQGNAGGAGQVNATSAPGGGGGGAGAVGGTAVNDGGVGGAGSSNSISGSAVTYGGGGGGGCGPSNSAGLGGAGGGGAGSISTAGTAGTANTGGGGGGGANANNGGAGGSGIVIISYAGAQKGTGGTVTSSGGNTIHTFTTSGTYTA